MTQRTLGGFTLIEMATVLVIIGLIIGGIMVGRDLIIAAEIRSGISAIEKYNSAVNAFETKYNCLPGDCPNATSFWGSDVSCPTGNPNHTAVKQATCNGDGDGVITDADQSHPNETFRFWQQLADAQLIQGAFTGLQDHVMNYGDKPGVNSPTTPFPGQFAAGISLWYGYTSFPDYDPTCNNPLVPSQLNHHMWLIGAYYEDQPNCNFAFTPNQAHAIDAKIDDGLPSSGQMLANQRNVCVNDTGGYKVADKYDDLDYLGSDPAGACFLFMIAPF